MDWTQQFLNVIQNALDMFEDEISLLTEEICGKAYRNYVTAYREALVPVWNLARFTSIGTVMQTIADKDLKEITIMAKCLKPTSPHPEVLKEKTKVPDLETVTNTILQKFPGQSLPESSICEKIGDIFSELSTAHKAYSEAAQGIAKLSSHTTTIHFATHSNSDTSHSAKRPWTTDVSFVHPAPTPAISEYCCRTFGDYEFYKNESSS